MKLIDNKCIINYAILLLGAELDTTREVFSEAHKIIKFIVLHLPTGGTLGFFFDINIFFFNLGLAKCLPTKSRFKQFYSNLMSNLAGKNIK